MPFKKMLKNNGLTLVLLALFLATWIGQAVTGWHDLNGERVAHGRPPVGFAAYLTTGHFLEATGENWESEFLQMCLFVMLSSFLFQKGSPESHDPDEGPTVEPAVTADSPWPVRAGGTWLVIYRHSLGAVFLLLFLASFMLHVVGGKMAYNDTQRWHGDPALTLSQYLGSAHLWFESLQNWQSEFLSLVAMVFFSVYLREDRSAQSKPVSAPHASNE